MEIIVGHTQHDTINITWNVYASYSGIELGDEVATIMGSTINDPYEMKEYLKEQQEY